MCSPFPKENHLLWQYTSVFHKTCPRSLVPRIEARILLWYFWTLHGYFMNTAWIWLNTAWIFYEHCLDIAEHCLDILWTLLHVSSWTACRAKLEAWLRPHDIHENPKMVHIISSFTIKQVRVGGLTSASLRSSPFIFHLPSSLPPYLPPSLEHHRRLLFHRVIGYLCWLRAKIQDTTYNQVHSSGQLRWRGGLWFLYRYRTLMVYSYISLVCIISPPTSSAQSSCIGIGRLWYIRIYA